MNKLNDLKPGDRICIYNGLWLDPNSLISYSSEGEWEKTVSYIDADYIILHDHWQTVLLLIAN
jgi:hypothetical protein